MKLNNAPDVRNSPHRQQRCATKPLARLAQKSFFYLRNQNSFKRSLKLIEIGVFLQSRWASMRTLIVSLTFIFSALASAASADIERFTHIAGFNLADLFAFDDLAKKFGTSPIVQSGDASTYDARV